MNKDNDTPTYLSAGKKPSKKEQLVAMTLLAGDWKKEFSEHDCKVMIAEALNYCVYNEGMKISGYLITGRRLCLVLLANPADVNDLLQLFYKELRKEIFQHTHRRKNPAISAAEKHELEERQKHAPLFIKYRLQNYMLIRLITGRPAELPYYSPYLARLKAEIHHHNFCSAVDYSGAIGPVVVTLLKQ